MLTHSAAIVPSLRLAAVLAVVHLAAAGVVWATPLPRAVQFGLTAAIALSLAFYLRRDALLLAPDSIVELEMRDDGGLACRTRRGEWRECDLLGSTYVSAPFTVVNVKYARGRSRSVVLMTGSSTPGDFRRLRIWLRWKGAGPEAPPQT